MNVEEKVYVDKPMRDAADERELEALNEDSREPIEETHPEAPFSVVALSYIVVLFLTAICVTAALTVWQAWT